LLTQTISKERSLLWERGGWGRVERRLMWREGRNTVNSYFEDLKNRYIDNKQKKKLKDFVEINAITLGLPRISPCADKL